MSTLKDEDIVEDIFEDTIVCSATEESYRTLFCEQSLWTSVTIPEYRKERLKRNKKYYCAIYLVASYRKIVAYAEIENFYDIPEGAYNGGKTIIFFKQDSKEELSEDNQIICSNKKGIRGRIYTSFKYLMANKGKTISLP